MVMLDQMPMAPEMGDYAMEPLQFEAPPKIPKLIKQLDEGNIVDKLSKLKDKTPDDIYSDINELYDSAKASMEKWQKRYTKALKLAKMQPSDKSGNDVEQKDFPFNDASLAMMPFILESMLDFASRASPELVWAEKIVSAHVYGMDQDQSRLARSIRVATFENYQLTNDIPGWRNGQDKLVMALPCVGTCYKKTYYDYEERQICSDLRVADKIVFDMKCDTFKDAPDKFECIKYSRNQVIGFIRGEQEWDIAEKDLEKDKDEFEFIEAHSWIDLDNDGLKEPYCAILWPEGNKIVCLYPDYDEDTISFNDKDQVVKIRDKGIYTQYIYLPDPEGGPMGLGWGIVLGPTFTAINTLVRNNIDAGTLLLTSSNSGLIAQSAADPGRGNRQLSSQVSVVMGQLTPYPISALNGSLRDNVVQFPFAGPNATLFQLTEYLAEAARKLSTAAYSVEAQAGEAASLYLAKLQQGLKVPNSIVMRVYEAAKEEFQKIALLNFKHHDSDYYNQVLDEPQKYMMEADFNPEDFDIRLEADPSRGSDIERVGRAQNVYDMAMAQAGAGLNIISLRDATVDLLKAQRVPEEDIERLAPIPDPNAPPSKEAQLILAQQAHEADLKERTVALKEQEIQQSSQRLELERLNQAHKAAKELSDLGLKADKDEADITAKYVDALTKLVKDAGLSFDAAKGEVLRIEREFIDEEPQDAIQAALPGPDTALAPRPGNEGIPALPPGNPLQP